VSSKADDFDVRYRGDSRDGRAWGDGADGDHGAAGGSGTVDYDLGYDANGWDTQGFRSPTAGYLDNHETAQLGDGVNGAGPAARPRHGGSHARPADAPQDGFLQAGSPAWAPEVPASTGPWLPDETGQTVQITNPGRRGRWARPGGPQGPDGPDGPGGPNGPRGPRGPRAPRVKVKGSWWRHWTWRKALGLVLSIVGLLVVLGAVAVVMIYENTSVPSSAMAGTGYSQTTVESSDGTLIGRFGTTNRVQLNYNQIPKSLIWAVLAIEDRNFFNEGGISPTGIIRAAYEDMRGGNLQGGSTITQEFVRQYYTGIGTQQTLSRKFKEIFVAMKVAKVKSKQWILQNFLNTIYFGDGAYGVQAAAETYFSKPVWGLTVAQEAVIAAVIQQPSTYLLPQYRSDLVARWHAVLNGMVATGHLTAQQAAATTFPVIGDNVPRSVGKDVWDPYILDMVYTELVDVYHFSQSQIYNGGYVIKTTIDDAKMKAVYQAVQQNEAQMATDGGPLKSYMHVGAVLENPANGAIEALYPGPGYPGSRYVDADGATHTMTAKECKILDCEVNMAVYNREQVGSSFKPYILATAVQQGMNVQTSTLDGFNNLCIPPDSLPSAYPTTGMVVNAATGKIDCPETSYFGVPNDNTAENGPFTPQNAMAQSINTAYTDLWHKVGGASVLDMAKSMGVNLDASGLNGMVDEAGVALGQASLTVVEQATMLATIDDNGVYHDAHVVASITQNGVPTPIKITSTLVFNSNPTLNTEDATQVQYAMSKTTVDGTATAAAMTDGREIVGKTGTTNTAQSAFFIGAIPQQALAVGMFTNNQSGTGNQTLNGLGGQSQGGFGGTWPATIWHTYAQNEFLPLPVVQFTAPVFTGQTWNLVPPNLRNVGKKHPKKKHNQNPGPGNGNNPSPPPGNGNPNPYPTYSCDPSVVTCNPNAATGDGSTQSVSAIEAGAAMGGIVAGLPATCLWVRRRSRRGVTRRG
jgi:membrane peptidoglycan carboxypeptidase